MPEGKCKQCGAKWYGWSLKYGHTTCDKCGGKIEIVNKKIGG
jgi:DNA-directed RNA polymerase subunit RPC12/RpoP